MPEHLISEAARATGFTESALRFYEREGLVVPDRTPAGYRAYRNEHLESLRFVARGKQLGLSLDEIVELLALLDEDECEPVQQRIRELVDERITQTQEQIAELVEFASQLQRVSTRLGAHTPEGACDEECGCRTDRTAHAPAGTEDSARVPLAGSDAVDVACSLEPDLVNERIDDWNRVLGLATDRSPLPDGVRVGFDRSVDITELARLAAAEQSCCSFFRFDIGIRADGATLDVTGPDEAQDVIASVFGTAAAPRGRGTSELDRAGS